LRVERARDESVGGDGDGGGWSVSGEERVAVVVEEGKEPGESAYHNRKHLNHLLCAETHNKGPDNIVVDEAGLDIGRESEKFVGQQLALLIGVLNLRFAG
jgi:hypothetical protein